MADDTLTPAEVAEGAWDSAKNALAVARAALRAAESALSSIEYLIELGAAVGALGALEIDADECERRMATAQARHDEFARTLSPDRRLLQ